MTTPNEKLLDAVQQHDYAGVQAALARNADPNSRVEQHDPLSRVVFRVSDCMLGDAELEEYLRIARLLRKSGADNTAAKALAVERYGPFDPANHGGSAMSRVLAVVFD